MSRQYLRVSKLDSNPSVPFTDFYSMRWDEKQLDYSMFFIFSQPSMEALLHRYYYTNKYKYYIYNII